jgi:hypothetical protein
MAGATTRAVGGAARAFDLGDPNTSFPGLQGAGERRQVSKTSNAVQHLVGLDRLPGMQNA